MRFKQTPAVEASLVYGIGLLLSFVVFLIFSTLGNAISLAQWLAALLLMPTWVLMVVVGQFTKRSSKFKRFFAYVSVFSVIAIAVGAFIIYGNNTYVAANAADKANLKNFTSTFSLLDLVYYVTAIVALVVVEFVIYRKPDTTVAKGNEYGALPSAPAAAKKPTRPAPPAKPKRNK